VIFAESSVRGAFVVELEPREDERGFFARAWCAREFGDHGLSTRIAQANIAFNERVGTLRGLHFQRTPHQEAKLVRCTRGAIYDVVVDLRRESPTHAQWAGVELTADNRRMLYVPEGCAHGYQTLADATEVLYQVSEFYAPESEGGARWDDPAFAIEWPAVAQRILSAKDASWPDYRP
jgi:dTDP-4-dehydrorhamnose 3,5-epimerase